MLLFNEEGQSVISIHCPFLYSTILTVNRNGWIYIPTGHYKSILEKNSTIITDNEMWFNDDDI